MKSSADVVVIGAGVQGLSAAYHLAKSGITDVVVVEMEFIGAGSSGRSASMLMQQRENREKIALSQYSFRRYMDFEAETGCSISYQPIGFLSVAPESKRVEALERALLRQQMGVRTEILTPSDIAKLVPVVNVADISVGVLGPEDGVIDAHAIMQGFAAAARRLGVTICQGVVATGISIIGGKVGVVSTSEGRIAAGWVVNAAGANANTVGGWLGVELPIWNAVRSIFLTSPFAQIPKGTPMVEDAEEEWYYRKEGDSVLMGMGKEPSGVVSNKPNWNFLPAVAAVASRRVPVLASAQIARGWSGVRPLTADMNPIIGTFDSVTGFVADCGWGGEGIMHAPAGGQIVADIINGRPNATFQIRAFSPDRFSGDPVGGESQ